MSKRILVVDDEQLIIKTLTKLLEKEGFDVLIAKSGQDAIAMVEEESFDLIIADIRMPGINGVDTIKDVYNILQEKNLKKMPVIFITGYADDKIEQDARDLEPVDYIYKPFDVPVLLGRVKEALK